MARPLWGHMLDQYAIGKSILAHAFQQSRILMVQLWAQSGTQRLVEHLDTSVSVLRETQYQTTASYSKRWGCIQESQNRLATLKPGTPVTAPEYPKIIWGCRTPCSLPCWILELRGAVVFLLSPLFLPLGWECLFLPVLSLFWRQLTCLMYRLPAGERLRS